MLNFRKGKQIGLIGDKKLVVLRLLDGEEAYKVEDARIDTIKNFLNKDINLSDKEKSKLVDEYNNDIDIIEIPKETSNKQSNNMYFPNDKLRILPELDEENRDTIMMAGPSGSGKSYSIAQYVELYNEIYPQKKIYLFSAKSRDPILDKYKKIIRVNILDPDFLKIDMNVNEFDTNCLTIFDDIDSLTKKIKVKVYELLENILRVGRSYKISCLYSSHSLSDYRNTKYMISEAKKIIIYPKTTVKNEIKALLNKVGFNDKDIYKLIETTRKSRWVCINKYGSNYVMYENGCYIHK
jgi:energy-coupling factor transporter ATP-binding protein EcfA2